MSVLQPIEIEVETYDNLGNRRTETDDTIESVMDSFVVQVFTSDLHFTLLIAMIECLPDCL